MSMYQPSFTCGLEYYESDRWNNETNHVRCCTCICRTIVSWTYTKLANNWRLTKITMYLFKTWKLPSCSVRLSLIAPIDSTRVYWKVHRTIQGFLWHKEYFMIDEQSYADQKKMKSKSLRQWWYYWTQRTQLIAVTALVIGAPHAVR